MNQLLIKIENSLLSQKKLIKFLFSFLWKNKKIKKDKKIKINKNIRINNPLSGSLANVWTEFKIPDLTRNVPHILSEKVVIDKKIPSKSMKAITYESPGRYASSKKVSKKVAKVASKSSESTGPSARVVRRVKRESK